MSADRDPASSLPWDLPQYTISCRSQLPLLTLSYLGHQAKVSPPSSMQTPAFPVSTATFLPLHSLHQNELPLQSPSHFDLPYPNLNQWQHGYSKTCRYLHLPSFALSRLPSFPSYSTIKEKIRELERWLQWLRALAAPTKDLSLVPNTYSFRDLMPLLVSVGTVLPCTYTQRCT